MAADMLLRPTAAAEYLGVATNTLANWRKAARGPRYTADTGTATYDKRDLDEYLGGATTVREGSIRRRILASIRKDESGCWRWQKGKTANGYGRLTVDGRPRRAHRAAYEEFVGPIPDGLQLDHLCRVRDCVNPAHLEPVTSRENTLRGDTGPARNAAKTECSNGHPFDVANISWDRGKRRCRTCARIRMRGQRARALARAA
jgi:hypothetical protein